jgi:ABC-type proline/glycine betaine transport system substrate-binding protein
VQPTTLDGITCIVVDKKLKDTDPNAYRFLQNFANSNELLTENSD